MWECLLKGGPSVWRFGSSFVIIYGGFPTSSVKIKAFNHLRLTNVRGVVLGLVCLETCLGGVKELGGIGWGMSYLLCKISA